jgi:hypothetical protein
VFLLTLTPLMLVMAAASVTGKPLFGLLLLTGACRFTPAHPGASRLHLPAVMFWRGRQTSRAVVCGGGSRVAGGH